MAVKHCLHFVQVGPGREGKVSDPIRCQAFAHVQIRRATDTADFRAAAFLRAASFYKYSPDRSQYAARIHQRMKGDAEWAAIEAKVSGKDTDYKGTWSRQLDCQRTTVQDLSRLLELLT
ncbi:TPA: hypothetical protein ACH3X1_007580 [Trebouxia sp. C0004]